eukprot:gene5614-6986_t
MSESVDIDWSSIDRLKRSDLQRLCKELSLPIKATSKNADIIEALKKYKEDIDKKESEKTISAAGATKKDKEPQQQKSEEEQEKEIRDEFNRDLENVNKTTTETDNIEKESTKTTTEDGTSTKNTSLSDENKNEDEMIEVDNYSNRDNNIEIDTEMQSDDIQPPQQKQQTTKPKHIELTEDPILELESLPIPDEHIDDSNTIKRVVAPHQVKNDDLINNNNNSDSTSTTTVTEEVPKEKTTHIGLKFRNYTPKDTTLVKYTLKKAEVPPIVDELMNRLKLLESGEELPISFAPKKINWDLKRDVNQKLSKLDKKTNNAIYQLIKLKLEKEGDTTLLTKQMEKVK